MSPHTHTRVHTIWISLKAYWILKQDIIYHLKTSWATREAVATYVTIALWGTLGLTAQHTSTKETITRYVWSSKLAMFTGNAKSVFIYLLDSHCQLGPRLAATDYSGTSEYGHIGDRSLILCREVVPFSEVGIEQTCFLTMLCLASLVPRLPRLGTPAPLPYHASAIMLLDYTILERTNRITVLQGYNVG